MNPHLAEIAHDAVEGTRANLVVEQAAWHMSNTCVALSDITVVPLPTQIARAELNPVESLWLLMRENWVSNRVFKSDDDIIAHKCGTRCELKIHAKRIMSVGRREWADGF